MPGSNAINEKRKHPRFDLDLPLEYHAADVPQVCGALVVNASESGLLVHSIKDMPIGTILNIAVFFPKGFQLSNFQVLAEIVWKGILCEENGKGYQLGLKFINMLEKDHQKLKQLLNDGPEMTIIR